MAANALLSADARGTLLVWDLKSYNVIQVRFGVHCGCVLHCVYDSVLYGICVSLSRFCCASILPGVSVTVAVSASLSVSHCAFLSELPDSALGLD